MAQSMDIYFPFDAGAGSAGTEASWRKMARLWARNGVVQGVGSNLSAAFTGPSTIVVQPGAVWVDGFYGESTSVKTFTGVASAGLLVARVNPTTNVVELDFISGFSPTQSPTGNWELPLYWLDSLSFNDMRPQAGCPRDIGQILWTAEHVAPLGHVTLDGMATGYRQDVYAAAYAALGGGSTPFGTGTSGGHATFGVPDARGRSPMGVGLGAAIGGVAMTTRTAGQIVGEEQHLLSSGEMPSHNHTQDINEATGVGDGASALAIRPFVAGDTRVYGTWGPFQTSSTGGGSRHNVVGPSFVLNGYMRIV